MARRNKEQPNPGNSPKTLQKEVVTLNEKSGYFYDPTSGLKLLPGKEVEVTTSIRASKRVKYALTYGQIRIIKVDIGDINSDTSNNPPIDLVAESIKARKVYDESDSKNIGENFKVEFERTTLEGLAKEIYKIEFEEAITDEDLIIEIVTAIDEIVEKESNN